MKKEEQSPSPSTSKPEKTKSTTATPGSRLLSPSTGTLPKPKNSSKTPEIVNVDGLCPSPKARVISTTTTTTIAAQNSARRRRSLSLNKSGQDMARAVPPVGVRSPSGRVVEQFARPTSQRLSGSTNSSRKTNEAGIDGKNKEMQDMLDQKHTLIRNLQADVLALKADLHKAHSLNIELRSHNHKLSVDLAAAEAKIATLTTHSKIELVPEYESQQFRDIQKLAANKLEIGTVKNDVIQETSTNETPAADIQRNIIKCPSTLPPPPPPPPPPPSRPQVRAATAGTASAVVALYHTLARHHGNKDLVVGGKYNKLTASSVHNSIVGEIQNRSAHLLAIKSDIETKQVLIDGLIKKVLSAAYTDIADVLKFVDWLDNELSSLADERAVLKHFNWPEKKADAMREAAIEYRSLKLLETEVLSYKDDVDVPCAVALKKMAGLLDKSEWSIHRLIKLRSSVMVSYGDHKIPTDWMLDSGIVTKIKQASIVLAKMYMKRVVLELESIQYSERESTQETLLRQGVQFAYRVHQFSGGLDLETLCAFEDIKKLVPGHLQGSQELFVAIPST
ncbi:hypothetical protein RJ639_007143 [Escallonia herrerae]|uniref:Protein CHUP1, chloroplastic n=1 Tax=Escallonia herrerae TaxID=1293975 RepID=A0AA88W500_9ASTE|nr:hypothetical protein RJ639_007143 [Escallonia herrerae]